MMTETGALDNGIAVLVQKLKGNEIMLIPVLMLIFSLAMSFSVNVTISWIFLALVPVLATVGFRVVMYDNREELAKKENYPMASEVIFGSFSDISGKVALTANDYAVVMTPGHQADYEILSKVLGSDATYIGCIGSRTKVAKTRERLKCDGYTEEDIARVHAPIGLPILAETPEEIAISIAAEMIEHRARLAGQRH